MSDDDHLDPDATRPVSSGTGWTGPRPAAPGDPSSAGTRPAGSGTSPGEGPSSSGGGTGRTSGPDLPVVGAAPGEDLPETVASLLRPGMVLFSRYELLRTLGRGGFGVVWHGKDRELDIDVALKFLADHIAASPDSVDDLKRETRYSLRLTHPHIVRIYNFIQEGSLVGISMEYVSGGTLPQLRASRHQRSLPVRDIAPLIAQLCDALEYAHTKPRIVHRDLKPGNLMLDARGELKIADFGISRSISDSHTRLTSQGDTSGTLAYMSPQQMMGEPPKPTDDIYSLGATIYDLLTGKPPFHTGDIVRQALNVLPPRMDVRRRDLEIDGEPIPEEWEEVVAACLAKEAIDRPSSAALVAERLGLRTPSGGSSGRTAASTPFDAPVSDATIVLPPSGGRTGARTGATGVDPAGRPSAEASRTGAATATPGRTSASATTMASGAAPEFEAAPRSRMPLLVGGAVLGALVLGGGAFLLLRGDSAGPTTAVVGAPGGGASATGVGSDASAPGAGANPADGPGGGGAAPGAATGGTTPDGGTTGAEPGGMTDAAHADLPALRTRIEGLLLSGKWDAAERELLEYQRLAPGDTRSEVWREELAMGRRRDREERELDDLVARFRRALDNRDAEAATRHLEGLRTRAADDPRLATLSTELEEARRSWRSQPIEETPREESRPVESTPRPEPSRPGAGGAGESAGDIERPIRALLRDYEEALERLDVGAYAALWSRFPSESRKILENSFRDTKELRIDIANIRIEPAGDRATVRFREHRVITPKAGREQSVDRDVRMSVVRQDGGWRITESGQ
jgi:serine/threonine protein kinase